MDESILTKDWSLVPSTHIQWLTVPLTPDEGNPMPSFQSLWAPKHTHTCTHVNAYVLTQEHICIHINKIKPKRIELNYLIFMRGI